jgi:hypothetical protein
MAAFLFCLGAEFTADLKEAAIRIIFLKASIATHSFERKIIHCKNNPL